MCIFFLKVYFYRVSPNLSHPGKNLLLEWLPRLGPTRYSCLWPSGLLEILGKRGPVFLDLFWLQLKILSGLDDYFQTSRFYYFQEFITMRMLFPTCLPQRFYILIVMAHVIWIKYAHQKCRSMKHLYNCRKIARTSDRTICTIIVAVSSKTWPRRCSIQTAQFVNCLVKSALKLCYPL